MVIMNENGIISVTYAKPWFWEVGEYATSLDKLFKKQIFGAQQECEDLLAETKTATKARLGPKASSYNSLLIENHQHFNPILITSLLLPYANKDFIDKERNNDGGELKPLNGEYCVGDGKDNIGMMNQMFSVPENPKVIGGLHWAERTCGELHVLKRCLAKLVQWEFGQVGRGVEKSKKFVDFKDDTHFRPYATYEARGDKSIFSQ